LDREQRLTQWRGFVALKEQKNARAIGVSNFDVAHLEELAAAGLPRPEANQIEPRAPARRSRSSPKSTA